MEAHQERVVVEKKELDDKIVSLETAVISDYFVAIEKSERERLRKQLICMKEYSSILQERIDNF